jgi:hypothetical protein
VPQGIRFGFQIFEPVLDDITNVDDATSFPLAITGKCRTW